jgi:hypothetical protein
MLPITILEAKDSTLDVFGLAKADGSFTVEKISFGEMIVMIKFQGYEAYTKNVNFSKANASVDLGTIYLRLAAKRFG